MSLVPTHKPPARALPAQVYIDLKAATRRTISRAGGVEGAAFATRVQKASLSKYENADQTDSYMPADVIADLEHDIGIPFITKVLARQTGHVLVPVVVPPDASDLQVKLARIGKESGELFARYGEALSNDGEIDAAEAAALIKEGVDLIEAVAVFNKVLEDRLNPVRVAEAGVG